jgi:uncharacterized protein YjbJ (UPF0337 family)
LGLSDEDMIMSKDRIASEAQKAVGAAEQALGKALGDRKLQAEGVIDSMAGSAKEAVGKAKDAVHEATK